MAAPKNQNNLNAIRLFAAAGVLVSHSFPLVSGSDSSEPLFIFSHGQTTFGHCAVIIFFAISGYLITTSYLKSQSKARFVLARMLRLLPGLAVVLIVLAFLLGPQISTLSVADYFGRWAPYHYVLGNLSLVVKFQDHLPSVFVNNPYTRAVNGSLWTLQYEAGCYVAVLLLGLIGALRWPVTVGLIVVCIVLEHVRRGGVAAELAIPFATGAPIHGIKAGLGTSTLTASDRLGMDLDHVADLKIIPKLQSSGYSGSSVFFYSGASRRHVAFFEGRSDIGQAGSAFIIVSRRLGVKLIAGFSTRCQDSAAIIRVGGSEYRISSHQLAWTPSICTANCWTGNAQTYTP